MIWYFALGLLALFLICFVIAFVQECLQPYRDHSLIIFGGGDKVDKSAD